MKRLLIVHKMSFYINYKKNRFGVMTDKTILVMMLVQESKKKKKKKKGKKRKEKKRKENLCSESILLWKVYNDNLYSNVTILRFCEK